MSHSEQSSCILVLMKSSIDSNVSVVGNLESVSTLKERCTTATAEEPSILKRTSSQSRRRAIAETSVPARTCPKGTSRRSSVSKALDCCASVACHGSRNMCHLTPRLSCAFVRARVLRQQAKRATKRQMQCLVRRKQTHYSASKCFGGLTTACGYYTEYD